MRAPDFPFRERNAEPLAVLGVPARHIAVLWPRTLPLDIRVGRKRSPEGLCRRRPVVKAALPDHANDQNTKYRERNHDVENRCVDARREVEVNQVGGNLVKGA